MATETKNGCQLNLETFPINTKSNNALLDLLISRAIEWKKKPEIASQISPRVFTDRNRTFSYFTEENSFLAGIAIDGNLCGFVHLHHIDPVTNTAILDIIIGQEKLWGKKIGPAAIKQSLGQYAKQHPSKSNLLIYVFIKKSNARSQNLFKNLGFKDHSHSNTLPTHIHANENDILLGLPTKNLINI